MDDQTTARLLDAAFDFFCQRRASELVDVERLLAAVDVAATEPRLARLIARLAAPARARAVERMRASATLLGAWLPEPARDAIAALLAAPAPIPRALIDRVVADEHVRDAARAMLQESLSSFIHKAFAVTPGGRGLRGMMRAAGGLFGGIGDEIQRQLEERVREFVDGGVLMLQQRVAQKLASEDTARLLGKQRRRAFLQLLRQRESDVAPWADRVPWPVLEAMLPSIVTHNLARAELRAALRDEVAAVVAELSTQPIGELFDELGLREPTRAWLHAHGLPLLRAFLASPELSRALGQ